MARGPRGSVGRKGRRVYETDPSKRRSPTRAVAKPTPKPKLVPVMRTIRGPKQGGYPKAGPGESVIVNKYGYNPSVRTPVGREYRPRRGGNPNVIRPGATNGTGRELRWGGGVQPPTYPQRFRLERKPTGKKKK
jgi:hypothetical protein